MLSLLMLILYTQQVVSYSHCVELMLDTTTQHDLASRTLKSCYSLICVPWGSEPSVPGRWKTVSNQGWSVSNM